MKEKILSMIRSKPGINESEIASLLDTDPKKIYPALEPIKDQLTITRITLPFGGIERAYRIVEPARHAEVSETKPNHPKIQPPALPDPATPYTDINPALMPAPPLDLKSMIEQEPVQSPKKTGLRSKKPGRTDAAMAHLEKHGKATSSEIRHAMGLPAGKPPHPYLKYALSSGRVEYRDGTWYLGKNTPAPPPEAIASTKTPGA